MPNKIKAIIICCITLIFSSFSIAAIEALQFQSAAEEQAYHELTQSLRCPQCQNNNIADSNALVATDMRSKVLELLQQGKSKQDVVNYMVERYGNFVTYDPPVTAGTVILWIAPVVLVVIGVMIFWRRGKSLNASANQIELTTADQARLDALLQNTATTASQALTKPATMETEQGHNTK